ncbi:DinB family protein [Streptomonospora sediminis]
MPNTDGLSEPAPASGAAGLTPPPPAPRVDAPTSADERTMLTAWLDWHRSTVWEKCSGLAPGPAHSAPLPSSPLVSVAGIVSHLRWVEHVWFEARLLGGRDQHPRAAADPYTEADPDADFRLGGHRPLPELLAEYARQCERSREITARLDMGGSARADGHRVVTLRWVLVHMIEETARHNGHLDILREMADGTTGE